MKNILVCVTGLTPQIVTEALYCLAVQKKIDIDVIYLLTTQRGFNVIKGIDQGIQTPKVPLVTEIAGLCKAYKIKLPEFNHTLKYIKIAQEESIELSDIRTDKDNILFPNTASEFLKKLTSSAENILYCVISGGRKTMSVHLANALSMFGRETDKLLHVLTSEVNEFKGFYPKSKKEEQALELSEIPFIRLRSIISAELKNKDMEKKSYSEFVEFTQQKLIMMNEEKKLILNTINKQISYGDKTIQLEPLQFALYYRIIEKRLNEEKPFTQDELTGIEFAKSVKEFLEEYIPSYHLMENIINPWWKKGFDMESFRQKRSKINSKLKKLFDDENYFTEFMINSVKVYYDTTYLVKSNKISIIYKE